MTQLTLLDSPVQAKSLFDFEREGEARVKPVNPSDHIDLTNATEVGSALTLENTLILMACSQTKKALPEGQTTMPLIDMYDGPMWQSLRTHLGHEYQPSSVYHVRRYNVVVLSGKFGITSSSAHWAPYEARLSPQRADHLISRGLLERQDWFGELKDILATTPLVDLKCPTTRINSPEPLRYLPWRGVIVAGGGDYRRVFMALLLQLQQCGHVAEDVQILSTQGGIGEQRAQLGRWVASLVGNSSQLREAA